MRPLLLLDVDGVLFPFAPAPSYTWHPEMQVYWSPRTRDALTHLMESYEIVWATMRGTTANIDVGPLHDLPPLDAISFASMDLNHQTFKLYGIDRYLEDNEHEDRPLVWMDDHIYEDGVEWARRRSLSVPTMAIQVDPFEGFTQSHAKELTHFAASSYGASALS